MYENTQQQHSSAISYIVYGGAYWFGHDWVEKK